MGQAVNGSSADPLPYSLYLDLQIAQNFLYPERGSIGYALEHAAAMVRRAGMVRGVGFNPVAPLPPRLHPELRAFKGLEWSTSRNFRRARAEGPLAYYMMSPFAPCRAEYLLPSYALGPETPLITTLVDLTPLTSDDAFFRRGEVSRRYRSRLQVVEQADLVLTISENTRREAIELLEVPASRVISIGTGVSERFVPAVSRERALAEVDRHLPGIERNFVLSVTGTWDWKNTDRLIEAFARLPNQLRSRHQLVVVCRLTEEYRLRWQELARRVGLRPGDLVLTDLVPDKVLTALYQTADLFVFPSLYEGFGLPAAEAAACGCPTITSNTSSMPEILEFPPATFDPFDPAGMSGLVERALTDDAFKDELRKAAASAALRHTWERVAQRTASALRLLPKPARPAPHAETPLRLGFAHSPANSGGSGDRLLRVAGELARRFQVDLLSPTEDDRLVLAGVEGTRCFPLEALGEQLNPGAYDAIVYNLGESPNRKAIEEKALRYPGIVWVADLSLSACHPRFGHGSGTVTKFVASAGGVVGSSEEQLHLRRLDQGAGARMPAMRALDDAKGGSQAEAAMVAELVESGGQEQPKIFA